MQAYWLTCAHCIISSRIRAIALYILLRSHLFFLEAHYIIAFARPQEKYAGKSKNSGCNGTSVVQ